MNTKNSRSKKEHTEFQCKFCGVNLVSEDWGGAACPGCGSVCVAEIPSSEVLEGYYRKFNLTYTGGSHSGSNNLIRYAKRYLELTKLYCVSGHLVDVGSSRNPFPNIASEAGFDVTVMDFTRPEDLSKHVKFVAGNLNDNGHHYGEGKRFDVVTAWAVVEHVPDPIVAVEVLTKLCRPQGIVMLSTPEIGTFITRHAVGRSGWFWPPAHLHLFSREATVNLFNDYGCTLIKSGRLELSLTRWMVRYGLGLLEALTGVIFKVLLPQKWQSLNNQRVQRFKGIAYFVFRKNLE